VHGEGRHSHGDQQRQREASQRETINQSIARSLETRQRRAEQELSTTERLRTNSERINRLKAEGRDLDTETLEGLDRAAQLLAEIVDLEGERADLNAKQADEQERANQAMQTQQVRQQHNKKMLEQLLM
jgi:hypothetical protein